MERAWQGEFDAIIAYSNSRLTRRPMELEGFIELYNHRLRIDRPIRIITMVSGEDDLSTADGRMVARFKAAADAGEAERTGERIARARKAKRDKGEPHSAFRPFGWQKDRIHLDPIEAQHAREAVSILIEGASLHEVCRGFNDAGLRTSRGNPWTYQTALTYFHNPRLAGYVGQDGELYLHSLTGDPVKGQWDPLIELDTFERLCARLDRNKELGIHVRDRNEKALLSGVLRCGVCGTRMHAISGRGGNLRPDGTRTKRYNAAYRCGLMTSSLGTENKHYMVIDRLQTEETVVGLLLRYMARISLETQPAPQTWPQEEELTAKEERAKALLAAFSRGELSEARVFPVVQTLEDEIATLKKARRRWLAETAGPIPEQLSREEWDNLPTHKQRGYIDRVFSSIVVTRSQATGRPRFDPDRLRPVWREAR
ncbi:recombinase family protein [Microlunatus parietis]